MIFNLLKQIQQYPKMFLHGNNIIEQLENLEAIIYGYSLALKDYDLNRPESNFPEDFKRFVESHYQEQTNQSIIHLIRFFTKSDEELFDTYFKLTIMFEEYLTDKITQYVI